MKKFVLLMALVLLCSCPLAQARFIPHAYAELSKTKAQELAFQYCEDELGYPEDTIRVYHYNSNNEGWRFSFKVKEADPTTNGLLIIDMDSKGNLTYAEGPQTLSLRSQFMRDWDRLDIGYQAVYQFQQDWKPRIANITEDEREEFVKLSHNRPFLEFMNLNIGLPTEQDIPYEEAVEKSREAILALPGWTQEMLDLMGIKEEVYITPPNYDRPVYQFIYALSSDIAYSQWIRNDPSGSFNNDALRKRNHQVFGDQLPMNINVRIDAQTGDVVGDICVQLSGTDCIGDPMRFFLWEVESPESESASQE